MPITIFLFGITEARMTMEQRACLDHIRKKEFHGEEFVFRPTETNPQTEDLEHSAVMPLSLTQDAEQYWGPSVDPAALCLIRPGESFMGVYYRYLR